MMLLASFPIAIEKPSAKRLANPKIKTIEGDNSAPITSTNVFVPKLVSTRHLNATDYYYNVQLKQDRQTFLRWL
jgi:hypothetical protein